MKTLEVTDEVYKAVTSYHTMTPSEVIKWWYDETFRSRMSSMSDSDFGR